MGTRTETERTSTLSAPSSGRSSTKEVVRQAKVLDEGGTIRQETRGWNDDKGQTYSMRSKEEADEYRYFPEPDLPPLIITSKMEKSAAEDTRRSTPKGG